MVDLAEKLGFLPTDSGPYVTELRALLEKKQRAGLRNINASFSTSLDAESRARALLSRDWEISHGAAYRVENVDGLIRKNYNLSTGKNTWKLNRPLAYFRDRYRKIKTSVYLFWSRKILRHTNPYK